MKEFSLRWWVVIQYLAIFWCGFLLEINFGQGACIALGLGAWLFAFFLLGFVEREEQVLGAVTKFARNAFILAAAASASINFPPGTGPMKTIIWIVLAILALASTKRAYKLSLSAPWKVRIFPEITLWYWLLVQSVLLVLIVATVQVWLQPVLIVALIAALYIATTCADYHVSHRIGCRHPCAVAARLSKPILWILGLLVIWPVSNLTVHILGVALTIGSLVLAIKELADCVTLEPRVGYTPENPGPYCHMASA